MTVIPIYRPYVFLRCGKCGRKTDHVLIKTDIVKKDAIEETYECQECGETKRIYELASMVEAQPVYNEEEPTAKVEEKLAIHGLEEKVRAKREALEQLESRKKELEKRLNVTTNGAPSDSLQPKLTVASASQQPKEPEDQKMKQREKKKRKWL